MKADKIGLVSRFNSKDSLKLTKNLLSHLNKSDVDILIEKETAMRIGQQGVGFSNLEKCDFIVTVGGDGTILKTFQVLADPVPILGINTGEVGFLTSIERDENYKQIVSDKINSFDVEKRERLKVDVKNKNLPPAVNEVVILTSEPAKMLQLTIKLRGREIERFRADGLVVSTPTGSTAYSMSAGGPILDPNVEAFVLVPIAPYKLSARPFVVPSSFNFTVELIRKGKEADLVVDGQTSEKISEGQKIKFTKAEKPAFFVKTKGHDFYSKIREKLI
ncbi:MAG: NAD kinase NadF [Candidatus Methanohalarchaeum thermophilum]|uniref:NAD kinase n=1 Tax=Methanohalarchaeum thermophilum TaxID=1903181 RepID=A0A1Q6DUV0_METT1|nr:MAG: NAD kinase NadF [Candidatus Methanohalarchaeum thermophilum]